MISDKRMLLIGGVSLIKGRVRDAGLVMQEVCNDLEPLLKEIGFLNNAPFETISMIIRFGEKTDLTPDYAPINTRYSELPVAVEKKLADLRGQSAAAASLPAPKTLQDVVRKAYDQGLRGDDVWRYVQGGSQRSNSGVDAALGLSR